MSKATRRARAYYDRRADVLSIDIRDGGEPKHVVAVRGTVVIYADDRGIYAIDVEAEEWDCGDVDKQMELMKVEIL
jgi:uncharacterized protein YuzE